jgi:hypothetical protein
MSIQVEFDEENEVIIVTDGAKRQVITKEEAKNVFVSVNEMHQVKDEARNLFIASMILLPVERLIRREYVVKIAKCSNENVEVFRGEDVNLAYDMMNRIAYFTRKDTDKEVNLSEGAISARNMNGPKTAGILEIISSPFVLFTLLYTYYGFSYEGYYDIATGAVFGVIILLMVVISILPIIGGIYAIKQKNWEIAFIGSIASLLFCLLGIPAMIFLMISKDQFQLSQPQTENNLNEV